MEKEILNQILEKHKKWLAKEEGGERANLRDANLCGTDLRGANLRDANLRDANLCGTNLRGANLRDANLRHADLRNADLFCANLRHADLRNADLFCANLSSANLSGADLSGANLDFSDLPLWCGSLNAHFDDKQLIQIAYHLVRAGLNSKNASESTKAELMKLIDFANHFHRVDECGKIEE